MVDIASTEKSSRALSVSAALSLAKGALEGVSVRIIGEVSEVSAKAGYKAVYFTVKDKTASLPCMMWNNRYSASGIKLEVGTLVELTGRFSLYAAKGRMNFDVSSISLAGEGNLRLQVDQLARRLEAEGLMDANRKRVIPEFPLTIGLVTSPRGAAVHDVLRTLRRRFPLARVLLAGVPVEGAQAPAEIIEGMRVVVHAGAEVVLVVRGGGSFEDLMPFNDEKLARTISRCPVPVVTGIGHEPDTTIADMVADLRASTPTAAAEAISPARESLESMLEVRGRSLAVCIDRTIEQTKACIRERAAHPVLYDSNLLFAADAQALDYASEHLFRDFPLRLQQSEEGLLHQCERLRRALPMVVERESMRVEHQNTRLRAVGDSIVSRFDQQKALMAARLHDLSPLAVLERGFSITRTTSGVLVKDVETAPKGTPIDVTVQNGVLTCLVEQVRRVDTETISWEEAQ